jgi:hypothetical protein
MKLLTRIAAVFACLSVAAVPLAAQDETQIFELNEAGTYIVEAPARAEIYPVEEFADLFGDLNGVEGVVITLDEAVILVVTPEEVATLTEIPAAPDGFVFGDYIPTLFEVLNGVYDSVVPEEEAIPLDRLIGGNPSAIIHYLGVARDTIYEAESALMITDPETGGAFFLDMVAPVGKLLPVRAEIDAMFESLAVVDPVNGADDITGFLVPTGPVIVV